MTVSLDRDRAGEAETSILEGLRPAYEQQGYAFHPRPKQDMIPAFLGHHVPDAIAVRTGDARIIQVRRRQDGEAGASLSEIRRRIADHEGWKLDVIYAMERPEDAVSIAPPNLDDMLGQISEARELRKDHPRAAFMLAWSLLEAALNRLRTGNVPNRLKSPGEIVQALAMDGHVEPDAEVRLRQLAVLRNRVVHGDLGAPVSPDDVEAVLTAVSATMIDEAR